MPVKSSAKELQRRKKLRQSIKALDDKDLEIVLKALNTKIGPNRLAAACRDELNSRLLTNILRRVTPSVVRIGIKAARFTLRRIIG